MTVTPFAIAVPDAAIEDLRRRLAATRWPDAVEGLGWRYGTDLAYLRGLVAYWRDRFDWRAHERALNEHEHATAEVDGALIHFVRVRGRGPSPLPIVLTHGWPSSFAELLPLAALLADPAAHGGDARDAFEVIVPSLPGYGFSGRPTRPGTTSRRVAGLWARLMTEELGFPRFAAHGGDIGAGVTNWLGLDHADRVVGIHAMATPALDRATLGELTPEERAFLDYADRWSREEGAYGHQQRTRPQTLAYGLNDSPAGLAAWIVEKWRAWSDCDGDVERRFTKDDLLTTVSLYWFTETIASSVRMYFEHAHEESARWPVDAKVQVPARLFLTTEEVDLCPREWAERIYDDLSYGRAPQGGHFLAAEEPELLADDLRAFFRPLRG